MPAAIETRALTRTFGSHTAVDAVDLHVAEGNIFGYLGLNGAGKTTTIKMLTTLIPPSSGSASVAGHDVVGDPLSVRRAIGLVGDESAESQPSWSAVEYVGYFAGIRNLPHRRAAVEAALDTVGLPPAWRRRSIESYSLGMKRRVELARALLGKPRVLFLDEPTRGLDLPGKRQIWETLRTLAERDRVTIFLSSHEVAEILALCGDLAILHAGRLSYHGTTRGLGSDPETFERKLIALLEKGAPQTTFELVARAPAPVS